jgi:hypothetical protein
MNIKEKYIKEFEIKFDSSTGADGGQSFTDYSLVVTHKKTQRVYKVENAGNVVLETFLENILISIRDEQINELLS